MIHGVGRWFYLSLINRVLAEAIRVRVLLGIRCRISPDFSMNTLWITTSKLMCEKIPTMNIPRSAQTHIPI